MLLVQKQRSWTFLGIHRNLEQLKKFILVGPDSLPIGFRDSTGNTDAVCESGLFVRQQKLPSFVWEMEDKILLERKD